MTLPRGPKSTDIWERIEALERHLRNEPPSNVNTLPGAVVIKNGNQSISSGVGVSVVTLDYEGTGNEYDTHSFFDDTNDRFVIPSGFPANGLYFVEFNFEWAVPGTTGDAEVRIRKNGVQIIAKENRILSGATWGWKDALSKLAIADSGDNFDFVVRQNSGANLGLQGDNNLYTTAIQLHYLGVLWES